jgi:hypothetical protein
MLSRQEPMGDEPCQFGRESMAPNAGSRAASSCRESMQVAEGVMLSRQEPMGDEPCQFGRESMAPDTSVRLVKRTGACKMLGLP